MVSQTPIGSTATDPVSLTTTIRIEALLDRLGRDRPGDVRVFHPARIGVCVAMRTTPHRLITSGARVRIVSDRRNLEDAELRAALRQMQSSGAHVRVARSVPHYLTLIDQRIAAIAPKAESASDKAVTHRSPTMISGMRALFDLTWRTADTLDDGSPDTDPDVDSPRTDPVTCEIIRLLSEGVGDEEAAAELGMSLRTFRRHVAGIKDMVKARSRFQTAVRLARRGLL